MQQNMEEAGYGHGCLNFEIVFIYDHLVSNNICEIVSHYLIFIIDFRHIAPKVKP
ncbi:MAG: hypothetical protein IBX40_03440 [Methanosarcinales archaeon]|nr:hypothetical protein [Methanosarcinales archaeon]